jgi:hypothetical protein
VATAIGGLPAPTIGAITRKMFLLGAFYKLENVSVFHFPYMHRPSKMFRFDLGLPTLFRM